MATAGTTGTGGAAGAGGAAGVTGGGGAGAGGQTPTGGASGNGGASSGGGTGGTLVNNCVKALFGRYLVRTDGEILFEDDAGTQTTVLDAITGFPLADVTAAQEGNNHGCAVLGTTQTAWCWRRYTNGNAEGQLGNGIIDSSGGVFRATQVLTAVNQPLTNVVGITDGDSGGYGAHNACAVTGDGKLYCWGNLTWITGGGTAINSPYAVPITTDGIAPLSGVLQVSVQTGDACAIVQGPSVKEVWCWGQNFYGAVGQGDSVPHRYPTKVVGIVNPTKVVVHAETSCALDGSNVRCWGLNSAGSTGSGTTASITLVPTLVALMSGSALGSVVDLHGGEYFGYGTLCALTTAGTLQCWGGGFANYSSAVGLTNIVALGGIDQASPHYMTSDGVYHVGTTTRMPNCGQLP